MCMLLSSCHWIAVLINVKACTSKQHWTWLSPVWRPLCTVSQSHTCKCIGDSSPPTENTKQPRVPAYGRKKGPIPCKTSEPSELLWRLWAGLSGILCQQRVSCVAPLLFYTFFCHVFPLRPPHVPPWLLFTHVTLHPHWASTLLWIHRVSTRHLPLHRDDQTQKFGDAAVPVSVWKPRCTVSVRPGRHADVWKQRCGHSQPLADCGVSNKDENNRQ